MTTTQRFSDLTAAQQRALARCHALVVPAGDEGRLKIHDRTLKALTDRGLIETVQDNRLRTVWRPTDRGLELLTSEDVRYLKGRGRDGGLNTRGASSGGARRPVGDTENRAPGSYTSDPGQAAHDENGPIEAVGDAHLAVFAEAARARDLAREKGVDDALLEEQRDLERRIHALDLAARERGVNANSDLRLARRKVQEAHRRLDAVEAKIRRQTEGRAA
jgi:hypothetical protein